MTINELKKDARVKLAGVYPRLFGMFLCYIIISFVLTAFADYVELTIQNDLLTFVTLLIFIAIDVLLVFGTTKTILKAVRNEDFKFFDFFTEGFKNAKKVWATSLRLFFKLFIPMFIFVIAVTVFVICMLLFGFNYAPALFTVSSDINLSGLPCPTIQFFIASAVITIISGIYYVLASLSYATYNLGIADNPESTSKEILNDSKALMKGNRGKYFLIGLSFIHYIILIALIFVSIAIVNPAAAACTIYILIALLAPYMTATQICFYEEIKEKKNSN